MSNLPDPKGLLKHKLKLVENNYFSTNSCNKDVDLEKLHKNYQKADQDQKELVRSFESVELPKEIVNTTTLLYEIFDIEFLRSIGTSNSKILNKYIGYSKYYKSLTISILDENSKVMSIAIREAFNKEGKQIKWKTYGSKSFVATKINNSMIFLGVGTAEYVLFELLGVDYILLQSDSMYRHIPQKVIEQMKGKTLIILSENDESFKKLIIKLKEIFNKSDVYVIDFEKVLGRELKAGYDARDFFNELKNVAVIEQLIEKEIIEQLRDKK